jgi:riboflavin kinase/FMN adenylyltransferase
MIVLNWDDFVSGALWKQEKPAQGTVPQRAAITIGVFDGVHRGHQALIKRIVQAVPGEPPLLPTVVSFRRNPKVLLKRQSPDPILNLEEKETILEKSGIAALVLIDFSLDFSKLSGEAFFELLCKGGAVKGQKPGLIVIGGDFHCGYQAGADAKAFKAMADGAGITLDVLSPVMYLGKPVSSSRIRKALAAGNYADAEAMLGRSIGHGRKIGHS